MLTRFRDSLLKGLGQQSSDGVRLELKDNESVLLDVKHVSVVKPRGLVFDGAMQGEAKTWSELYLRLLETLARVDGEKFEELPDVDPGTFVLKGKRIIFERKGKKRHEEGGRQSRSPQGCSGGSECWYEDGFHSADRVGVPPDQALRP